MQANLHLFETDSLCLYAEQEEYDQLVMEGKY